MGSRSPADTRSGGGPILRLKRTVAASPTGRRALPSPLGGQWYVPGLDGCGGLGPARAEVTRWQPAGGRRSATILAAVCRLLCCLPGGAGGNEARVRLTPHEQERLLIHVAAELARERRGRGLRLNHPEAVALITSFVLEGARDGRPVADLMEAGRGVLTRDDVMDGVVDLIGEELQV